MKRHIKSMLALALSCAIIGVPSVAFAGVSDSHGAGFGTGSSGNGGKGFNELKTGLRWQPFINAVEHNNIAERGKISQDAQVSDKGVYLAYSKDLNNISPTWQRWPTLLSNFYFGIGDAKINSICESAPIMDGLIQEEIAEGGYLLTQETYSSWNGTKSTFLWYNRIAPWDPEQRQLLDAVWISERPIYRVEPKHIITKTSNSGGFDFDDSNKGNKWLWNHGKTQSQYKHTTPMESETDSHVIDVTIRKINKITTGKSRYEGGRWVDYINDVKYVTEFNEPASKTILYQAVAPQPKPSVYKFLDLNTNTYVTEEKARKIGYTNEDKNRLAEMAKSKEGVKATVDNMKNITNGEPLKGLDINTPIPFKMKFDNGTFGLPDNYNWNNHPGDIPIREKTVGPEYANGHLSKADPDGLLRNNLRLTAGIMGNEVNALHAASITFNGKESEVGKSLVFDYNPSVPFVGGDFFARFIHVGDFDLTHSKEHNTGIYASYNIDTFYEYGCSYRGLIVADPYVRVKQPEVVDPSGGDKPVSHNVDPRTQPYKITTACDKHQRGLYTGRKTVFCEQPIVIGKWKISTMAGDTSVR